MKRIIIAAAVTLISGCHQQPMQPEPAQKPCNGITNKPFPAMPVKAQALGIEGNVVFSFSVGDDGHPHDIRIVSAQPEEVFERETLRAVQIWCLSPNKSRQTETVTFTVNKPR